MKKLLKTARGSFNIHIYGESHLPPIILLHGWPQTGYCWYHMAQHMEGFYVIAPDLRGMGDSNRELEMKSYEKDEMAKDMFAVADALGIDSFFLGGHDWGGAIIQEMAFLHPERIKKLIILNMILINNPVGQAKAGELLVKYEFRSSWYQNFLSIKDFPEAMIAGKEDIWIRFFSRGISNPVPEDAIAEYIRCYKIPHTLTTAAHIYRCIPKDRKRWAQHYMGKKIEVPTKIIHGILDPVIIKEFILGAEDYYPNLEIARLNGGHFIVDEQPEAVAQEIKGFLMK